jgi:hypothetical protein
MAEEKPKKKKKRKVGRPKKRGRKPLKKKSSKKVLSVNNSKKGFGTALTYNRVRKLLWKEFKDDFSSYREFISSKYDENGNKIKGSSITSKVYSECKSQDCLDDDVILIYQQLNQVKSEDVPQLPSDYYDEPKNYWTLLTENWWGGFPAELWVSAPMLISNPDSFIGIYGEDRYIDSNGDEATRNDYKKYLESKEQDPEKKIRLIEGYKNRFQPFVDYCNQIQSQFPEYDNYVAYWRFIGTDENPNQAYWNEEKKRWEIRIVICTQNGDINDYDFDPNEDEFDVNIEDLPTTKKEVEGKEVEQEKVETSKLDKELEKKLDEALKEIERLKAETKKINAEIEIKKIDAEIEEKKRRDEIEKIKAETERKKVEAEIEDKKAEREQQKIRERIDQIKELTKLGYTKEEINKILGI